MRETDGPRMEMTERLAAYREMEAIAVTCASFPTITLRGHSWEILGSGLSRCVDAARWKYEAIPMGDLRDDEWRRCLAVMRLQERRP